MYFFLICVIHILLRLFSPNLCYSQYVLEFDFFQEGGTVSHKQGIVLLRVLLKGWIEREMVSFS